MLPRRFRLRAMMVAVFLVAFYFWAIRTIASIDRKAAMLSGIGLWWYTVGLIGWATAPVTEENHAPRRERTTCWRREGRTMFPRRFGLRAMMVGVFLVALYFWLIRIIVSQDYEAVAWACIGLWWYTVALIGWATARGTVGKNLPYRWPRILNVPLAALILITGVVLAMDLGGCDDCSAWEDFWERMRAKAEIWTLISSPFVIWCMALRRYGRASRPPTSRAVR